MGHFVGDRYKVSPVTLVQAKRWLPRRKSRQNKSMFGKTLIIAGSKEMFGAAVLASVAASRVGSGYVYLCTDAKRFPSAKHPDFIIKDFSKKVVFENFSAIGVGPGLGKSKIAKQLIRHLIQSGVPKVVLDADALNICAEKNWFPLPKTWIATPHEGELSRILMKSSQKIQNNRKQAVRKAQEKMGCIVLLKGKDSLIANEDEVFTISSGNVALAKAGTGDVLTGMITGFLAQGLSPLEAVRLGSYIHGKIADDWLKEKKDAISMMASDILERLPTTIFNLRHRKQS